MHPEELEVRSGELCIPCNLYVYVYVDVDVYIFYMYLIYTYICRYIRAYKCIYIYIYSHIRSEIPREGKPKVVESRFLFEALTNEKLAGAPAEISTDPC